MKGPEADKLRVRNIPDAMSEIEGNLKGVNKAEYMASSWNQYPTIKQIEKVRIGLQSLTDDFQTAHQCCGRAKK